MALFIRMFLYFLFPLIAAQGLGEFDPKTGALTIHIESAVTLLSGVAGFIGTYATSRWAKARGGVT